MVARHQARHLKARVLRPYTRSTIFIYVYESCSSLRKKKVSDLAEDRSHVDKNS